VVGSFRELIPSGPNRRVAILADPSQRRALQPWLDRFSGDRVHVLSPEEAPEWELEDRAVQHHSCTQITELTVQVRALGAIDVMVDLLPTELLPSEATDHLELFSRLFRSVRKGGVYILDRRAALAEETDAGIERWLRVLAAASTPGRHEDLRRSESELARSTGAVVVTRDLVMATKRVKHYLKLRHARVDRMLVAREPHLRVRELERLRGATFESKAVVTSHPANVDVERMPQTIEHPALYLRHYQGKIALAGSSLMFVGHTILPDSFRWHLEPNPSNPAIKSVSHHYARIPSDHVPKRGLAGNYYTLDCAYSGHFGHVTSEVLSRIWGWDRAKEEIPDLKAIFHVQPGNHRRPSLELDLFTAYGIPESDIVWVNEPVWLESVVSAMPMWHNELPYYAHPGMTAVWDRLTAGLMPSKLSPDLPDRIFVSRNEKQWRRTCRNADDVEALFEANGFTVVHPEHLELGQQVELFSRARVVAGFGGSGMFNLMHAKQVKTVICLNQEAYTARNEHLFTSLIGCDVHYFWSAPDVSHTDTAWKYTAFVSDWEFDFDRNGTELSDLLASL
jgi:capsular polysaccharide biosynthesis protein